MIWKRLPTLKTKTMHQAITTNLTPDELTTLIELAVNKAMGKQIEAPHTKTEIIDRSELCRRLNITEPTCIRYEKKGKLPRIEIGSSIRYDWNRVIKALEGKWSPK
jgi:predicted DNA-binding transcriptional regulator AlpA